MLYLWSWFLFKYNPKHWQRQKHLVFASITTTNVYNSMQCSSVMKASVCFCVSVRRRVYVRSPESNRVNQAKGYFTQTFSKGHEGNTAIKAWLALTLSSRSCNTDVTAHLHSQFSPHSRQVRTALQSAINQPLEVN